MTDVRVAATVRSPLPTVHAAALARAVLRAERANVAALSITFVGPGRMRSINREHLGHDRATDVIAFSMRQAIGNRQSAIGKKRAPRLPLADSRLPVVGDVYICPSVAAANARAHGTTAAEEVRRLVVHGVLHALGYDHPAGERRTASPMWRRQERHLKRFQKPAP